MPKNIYRTAQGQLVDIDNLRLVNESVIAVGNMGVNTRGDRVSPSGEIIETRNQVMKKRYDSSTTTIGGFPGTRNSESEQPKSTVSNVPVETANEDSESNTSANSKLRGSLAQSVTDALANPIILDNSKKQSAIIDNQTEPKLKRI